MSYDPIDDYDYPDPEWCEVCEEEVTPQKADWGIGAYEYWGAKGTHHKYVWVCPQCQEEVKRDWWS